MKARIVVALCLAFVALLAMSAAAGAEQGSGAGTLTAQGDGLAALRGNGTITLSGSGMLIIHDPTGHTSIHVEGKGFKRELRGGWIVYVGFDGEAHISGGELNVTLRGKNIHLRASGNGRFLLRGQGTYETSKESGEWTERGQVVVIP